MYFSLYIYVNIYIEREGEIDMDISLFHDRLPLMRSDNTSSNKSMQLRLHNCVCVNMRSQSGNINISRANDLFTPKPAKHDKHIH